MASTIPAFIDAYLAALAAPIAAMSPAVALHDGPPMGDEHLDYFAVGYSENGNAVEAQERATTLQNGRLEEYLVACQAVALSGDNDMRAARTRAFAIRATAAAVLTGDWDVSGSVTFAEMDTAGVQQLQTDRGAICVIDLAVAVRITPL